MSNTFICAYKRTPIGAFQGSLSNIESTKLGSISIESVLKQSMIDKTCVVCGPSLRDTLLERINMSGLNIKLISKGLTDYKQKNRLNGYDMSRITLRKLQICKVKLEFDAFMEQIGAQQAPQGEGDNQPNQPNQ